MENQQSKGLWHWGIVKFVLAFSAILYAILFITQGFEEESNRYAIRWSARISVTLFSLAFGASAIQYFWKNVFTFWLLMNRKYLGISFAISHLTHLFFLLLLQQNFHPVFEKAKTIPLLGGGLAYLFLVLMLLTSFERFSKYLSGKNWLILHTAGGYWIWYIFIRSYVKRAMTEWEYLPLVILLAVVFGLRIFKLVKSK